MNKELQEIRNVLENYIRENYAADRISDHNYLESDVTTLQQKEADRYLAAMMKQHRIIIKP